MDRRQDKDLTLADFKKWVERKFEDLEKKNQQIVTDVQGATGQTDVSSAGVARLDLMEENPSSDYYDSQRESTSAHGQFQKEASKPLKNLEPGDPSIQQMLLEMLGEQKKMGRQISAVNDTLEKEKRFMRDELQNAQGDIIKRLENIKYQTTHFENRFHELAEKLENKVEETRTITENQKSDCVGVMSQTVRDMTSKVEQEIKTVQACVQQCQLSPNKQDLNIPDLKVLMGEVLKDFLHPVEKAVENQGQLKKLGSLAIKQEIEELNIKLDGLSSKLTDQEAADTERSENCSKQIVTTINEKCKDLEKSIKNVQQELRESNQSTQKNLKSQIIQSVTQMTKQIQKSENSIKTKLSQNVRDSETRITGNIRTVTARLEENLTQQNQGREDQLKTHVAEQIQTSKQSLETKLSQNVRDSETRITGNISTVIARLEKNLIQQNQGRGDQLKTHVAKQIQTSKQSLETKLSQNVRDSETRITGNINAVTARLEENLTQQNQEREDQLKKHVAEQIQTSKQSLETKLSQNLRDSEKRITGNINAVTDRLEGNLTQQILNSENSIRTELTQRLDETEGVITGNINSYTGRLEENLTQQNQKSEKSLKDEMGNVKGETIQQIKQASNESCQITKTDIQTNLKTNTETMKVFMTCVKRELFKFIEKESSITRIKITDPTAQVRSSTFDFYVKNFKDLVKSDKDVYSVPWYIDEFKSSVEGSVFFTPNGDVRVWLLYGRNHHEMGLQQRRVKLSVRATITDRSGVLPDLLVGEDTKDWNEENVTDNRDWGSPLGTLKCQDVIQKGYDKCGRYWWGSVLVRYHIDVV